MRRDDLIDMMKAAGVAAEVAEARADATLADATAADTLNKSLEALADVARAQALAEAEQSERLAKAVEQGELNLAETLAPALDAMLTEQRAQNAALAKGLTGALDLIKGLKADLKALRDARPAPASAPMAKSVDYIPAPGEIANGATDAREELIKALSTASTTDANRASQLMHAAALLESGADPLDIKRRFF
jgi:hypothetical protein